MVLRITMIAMLLTAGAWGRQTDRVTQYGITWYFGTDRTVGQFANGDWWVLGPVTIDSITPSQYTDGEGLHNGWEVNPICDWYQGFDGRLDRFNADKIPTLPYTATGTVSIIKTISRESCCYPGLQTAAVLTVVDSIPADSGRTVLRPPYAGTEKPYYSINTFRTDLLPSLAPVAAVPGLTDLYDKMKYVRMDHIPGNTMLYRPADNLPDYGADINQQNGDAILRLFMNDPLVDKMPLLIAAVQGGVDYNHFIKLGQNWYGGGGEQPGNILPPLFAAVILDNQEWKDRLLEEEAKTDYYHKVFYEKWTLATRGKDNRVLWGHHDPHNFEASYWQAIMSGCSGTKTLADPYGYIDGGCKPGDVYQHCCTSQPFKSTALCLHLMPALKTVWDPDYLYEYTDRWVDFGTWTQPDPCAPVDSNKIYKVDFGPDPANPGDCIHDPDLEYYNGPLDFKCKDGAACGRFPELHGSNKDGGGRKSNFAAALWNAYRNSVSVVDPDISVSKATMPAIRPNPASGEMWVGTATGMTTLHSLQGVLVKRCMAYGGRVDLRGVNVPDGMYWVTSEGVAGARMVVICR